MSNRTCKNCGIENKKLLLCRRCFSVYYCDVKCQKKDWSAHKITCLPATPAVKMLDTKADSAAKIMNGKVLPKHENKNNEIDNEQWVRQHSIFLDANNIELSFNYIKKNHPLVGCSRRVFPALTAIDTIEQLASYADAVTVACVERLGTEQMPNLISLKKAEIKNWNHTGVGNLAYIAIHHSTKKIRTQALAILEKWRSLVLHKIID